jgi:formylglycine-generating enzyme required for sulfatase activity
LVGALAACLIAVAGLGYSGFLDPSYLEVQARTPWIQARKYMDIYLQTVLTAEQERALKPGDRFQGCASCPEMVVVPAGEFMMGSEDGGKDEKPAHQVMIAKPFAVGRFSVTFDEWDGCVAHGGWAQDLRYFYPYPAGEDQRWGRSTRPVIGVSWMDAQQYVAWLSKQTGKTYRLLTELRGGSSSSDPVDLRSADRGRNPSTVRGNDIGFRVARTLTP